MALSGPELETYLAALRGGCPPDYRYFGSDRVGDLKTAQSGASASTWPGKSGHGTKTF